MQTHRTMRLRKSMVCFSLGILLLGAFVSAVQTDEELKKKYAPILGQYEFDMTAYGMGVLIVDVYVEYGSLWALPNVSDTAGHMIAVEEKEFEFKIEDPDEGTYEIKFMKDEDGEYSKCHVKNEFAGMDVIGTKIK